MRYKSNLEDANIKTEEYKYDSIQDRNSYTRIMMQLQK